MRYDRKAAHSLQVPGEGPHVAHSASAQRTQRPGLAGSRMAPGAQPVQAPSGLHCRQVEGQAACGEEGSKEAGPQQACECLVRPRQKD